MKKTFKFLVLIVLGNFYLIACSGSKKITSNDGYTPIVNEKNAKDTLIGLENGYSSKKKIELIDQKKITEQDIINIENNIKKDTVVELIDTIKKTIEEPIPTSKPFYINPFAHLELKDTFNIALILPFNLGQTPTTLTQKQNFKFDASTKLALDYYQGFMTSINNFNGNGLVVNVKVLDDKNDENATQNLINNGKLTNCDLIVGPIYNKNLRIVAPYALENKIPIFSPLSPSSNIAQNNPYYFSVNAVNESFYGQILTEVYKKQPYDTIYLFNEGTEDEAEIMQIMHQKNKELGERLTMIDFKINRLSDTLKIPTYFSDTLQKNIIITNHNESFVSYMYDRLKILSKNKFNIYGLSTWVKFNKKIFAPKNISTVIPSSNQSNYGNGELDLFKKLYETKYDKKPADASFQAHDLVVLLSQLLSKKKFHPINGFQLTESSQLIYTKYDFLPNKKPDGQINFYSNHFVYFLKFDQGSSTFIKN
jgi:hypothetical protein